MQDKYNEEDFILPDDYEDGQDDYIPSDDDQDDSQIDNPDDEERTPADPEQIEEKIKIRFNHEDLEIPMSEAQELLQKGKNYEKVHSRLQELESDPRLTFVQRLAEENDMDVPTFLEMFEMERQQAQLDQLISDNIPPELAEEILEARKDRAERKREKEQKAKQETEEREFQEFFNQFRALNNREYSPGTDILPPEVWQAQAEGTPLRYAYLEHYNKQLQDKIKIIEQNKTNSERSPVGSTQSHGGRERENVDPFLEGWMSES